jgi:CubicO group peptidase (beta-lactamase class C family)
LTARLKTIRAFYVCIVVTVCLPTTAFADAVQTRIDHYFETVGSNDVRVEVLLSRKNQPLIHREYQKNGHVRVSTDQEPNSIFPIGTIAEQFVAAALLQFQEQGKIRLDESVCHYLSKCPKTWSEVKIIHLLTHTSGLPLQASGSLPNSSWLDTLQNVLPSTTFKPGTMFRYTQLDFVILDSILGELSGQPPQEYIETKLFRQLKMERTAYGASGGASSTMEDLYRWNLALERAEIISPASFNQMLTPYRDGHSIGWKIIKEFDRRMALRADESELVSVSIRMYPDDETLIIVVAHGIGAHAAPLSHDIAAIAFGRDYPLSRDF